MGVIRIAIIVGSLRAASINRKLAKAVHRLLPDGFEAEFVGIGDLPLYNQEFDGDFPAPARSFKQQIAQADALLFVTPEYNRSIPGVLKNAIDVGSRPSGDNTFAGKLAAVLGTSPGAAGSALAQQHLRNVLVGVGVETMPQPEVFVQFREGMIDDEGVIDNERTQKFLQGFVDRYTQWLRNHLG